ncbi:MAG: DMT family transporter [Candidatus Eisenbacteria bacterium]
MSRPTERTALVAMVVATLLWGGTFVVIRDSVAGLPPALMVGSRFVVAAVLFGLALLVRRRGIVPVDFWGGLGSGVFVVGGYFFQAEGLRTAAAGTSAFLTCAGTLLAAFFAWPLLKQRPTRLLTTGILVAMAGSALMSLRGSGFHLGRGESLTLLGAAMYALQIVFVSRVARTADSLTLAFAQSLTVACVLLPFARDPGAAFAALDPTAWRRLAYLAVAGSTLAPLLQLIAQRTLPAGRIALLFALEPVFALVFALTLGGERFEPRWWVGAALILSAVVMVESRSLAAPPCTT